MLIKMMVNGERFRGSTGLSWDLDLLNIAKLDDRSTLS